MTFLKSLNIPENVKKIRLFSDACASQNRNSTIVCACHFFCTIIKPGFIIEHYYPIRGHSFLPADRIFGRTEKVLRKKEILLLPSDYHNIYVKFGELHVLGENWQVLDCKQETKSFLKVNFGLSCPKPE